MSHPHSPWIEITTIFPCAVNCSYCPQDRWKSAYKGERLLTLERFKRVLVNVPKSVMVDFSGFAEPFLNPACVDMVLYAYDAGYRVEMKSTLVGLSEADAERIARVKFGAFWYHVPPYDHVPGISGPDGRDAHLKKAFGRAANVAQKLGAHFTNRQLVDAKVLTSRAGKLFAEERKESEDRICAKNRDHKVNVMMPNGDVYLCCCDYSLDHKLGNLLETHFDNLSRQKSYELCHYCPDWVNP